MSPPPAASWCCYGCNGGNESAFPACAAFLQKHLQFYRHCLMDFTGHPEMGLERNDESVSKAPRAHRATDPRSPAQTGGRPGIRVRPGGRGAPLHGNLSEARPGGDPRRRLKTTRSEKPGHRAGLFVGAVSDPQIVDRRPLAALVAGIAHAAAAPPGACAPRPRRTACAPRRAAPHTSRRGPGAPRRRGNRCAGDRRGR